MDKQTNHETVLETKNSVLVETLRGDRTFNLMYGDITEVRTDLLVASTHSEIGFRYAPGEVLSQLQTKYGAQLDPQRRWLSFHDCTFGLIARSV